MPPETLISDEILVGSTPGAPNTGLLPTTGQPNVIRIDLLKQYVAAGGNTWLQNWARSLSFAVDDLTADFGQDLYDRMLLNSTVAGTVNGFRSSILEDGMELRPAVENEDEDGYDQAVKLVKTYERAMRDLPMDDICWDLLGAIYSGNRVAEITYDDTPLAGTPKLYVAKIDPKPRESTAFVVDSFNNVIGLLARIPGVAQSVMLGTMLTQPDKAPNLIPRSKFVVLSWRPKAGDPRGTSVLRPAYTDWYELIQISLDELRYLSCFASPSIVGTTAEGAEAIPILDADGNPTGTESTPEQAMSTALQAFKNGTVMAIPFGAKVEAIAAGMARQSPFADAKDERKRNIVQAILSQTLSSMEAQHQSKSAGEVHQDLGDVITRQGRRALGRAIYNDVMRAMVRFNEPADMEALAPRPWFGVEQHNYAVDATATASLFTSGFIDPSQQPGLDKKLGLPPRSEKAPPTAEEPQPAPVIVAPGQQPQADPNAPTPIQAKQKQAAA